MAVPFTVAAMEALEETAVFEWSVGLHAHRVIMDTALIIRLRGNIILEPFKDNLNQDYLYQNYLNQERAEISVATHAYNSTIYLSSLPSVQKLSHLAYRLRPLGERILVLLT